jgi:hypothetical protein
MSHSANAQRDYHLTFRSQMDPMGSDMFGYLNVIRVDGASGRAVMVLNRHGGDTVHPIGLFAATLPAVQVNAIATAVDGIKWSDLPRPRGGDVNAATLSLEYAQGSRIIQRTFNARNGEFLQALSPVMNQIDRLGSLLLGQPSRAVDVAVVRTTQGFKLVLRNLGTGPVMVADPRQPAGASGVTRGKVEIAEREEATPGSFSAPPTFSPVPLQPPGNAPQFVVLAPGQTFTVETVAWTPPAPGKYFAQAEWQDYAGPTVNPKTVMPMIPDPGASEGDARPYMIRGTVFSDSIKFDVQGRR